MDLFPEREYQNGLKKILQVVSPGKLILRSKPMKVSEKDVHDLIRKHNFFDRSKNLSSNGFPHEYKEMDINGDKVIFDKFSCLMWQQSGSEKDMSFENAKNWIKELNRNRFAGFNNWRLPTLEEAMSLMEPKLKNGLYVNPIFDHVQQWIWTADQYIGAAGRHWVVVFDSGKCSCDLFFARDSCVRAVRSI